MNSNWILPVYENKVALSSLGYFFIKQEVNNGYCSKATKINKDGNVDFMRRS